MTIENGTLSHRRRRNYWPAVAFASLVLSAWLALGSGDRDARADNGGAAQDGIIAMMGINANNEHLYIIDTRTRTLMMYEVQPRADFKLVAARSYDLDNAYVNKVSGKYLPYKQEGYEKEVAKNK